MLLMSSNLFQQSKFSSRERMEFSEEEVREQLSLMGYDNVPNHKLREFMRDLERLIELEQSTATSQEQSEVVDDVDSDETIETGSEVTDEESYNHSHSRIPFSDLPPQEKQNRSAFSKTKIHIPTGKENVFTSFLSDNVEDFTTSVNSIDQSCDVSQAPESNGRGKTMKRKVNRKRNGESRVFDETLSDTASESADITMLEERLRTLPVRGSDPNKMHYEKYRRSVVSQNKSNRRPLSSQSENDASINSRQSASSDILRARPSSALPAFICPSTSHPHTRNIQKCDPVARYHQFSDEWKMNRVPGEKKRSTLRWNVREAMLKCEVFERPQRPVATNNYVVPTEKKRQALRWQVRTALANQ